MSQSIEAEAFTVSSIDAQEKKEEESLASQIEEKKREEASSKSREKMMAQMLKPPPPAIIREQIKQNDKARHDAEEVEKRKLFLKIQLYFERFPGLMTKIPKISARSSLVEAEEILNQIRHTMNSMGSCRNIIKYVEIGFTVLERFMSQKQNVARFPNIPIQNHWTVETL